MRAIPRDRDRRAGDDPGYADNAGKPPNAVFSKLERARAAKAGDHGTNAEGPLSVAVSGGRLSLPITNHPNPTSGTILRRNNATARWSIAVGCSAPFRSDLFATTTKTAYPLCG
jgi:hypothetical protein